MTSAERVRAFLEQLDALGLCENGILFGIPGKHNVLLVNDLRELLAEVGAHK